MEPSSSSSDFLSLSVLLQNVHSDLRRLAAWHRRRLPVGPTLQTTALVNEAYLRLAALKRMRWTDEPHFLAVASSVMRHVLFDYVRKRLAQRRGCDASHHQLDEARAAASSRDESLLLDVHHALRRLETVHPQHGRIVELRFFGGMSDDEIAAALGISARTVRRNWANARAWLSRELTGSADKVVNG